MEIEDLREDRTVPQDKFIQKHLGVNKEEIDREDIILRLLNRDTMVKRDNILVITGDNYIAEIVRISNKVLLGTENTIIDLLINKIIDTRDRGVVSEARALKQAAIEFQKFTEDEMRQLLCRLRLLSADVGIHTIIDNKLIILEAKRELMHAYAETQDIPDGIDKMFILCSTYDMEFTGRGKRLFTYRTLPSIINLNNIELKLSSNQCIIADSLIDNLKIIKTDRRIKLESDSIELIMSARMDKEPELEIETDTTIVQGNKSISLLYTGG